MRQILAFLLAFAILGMHIPVSASDGNYFVVTAYYSPLPEQEYYITGNYEDELILNGRGVAGASGKPVFSGMLAAPGKYAFGTKIYLDGLGIGAIEDRGGAIVPAGQRGYSYDRIDVWVGYGDEGLLRANFWGKRKVYGYVVDSGNTTALDYNNIPAPKWATTGLKKQNTIAAFPDVFDISLGTLSDSTLIEEMQGIFSELGFDVEVTGLYDEATINSVYLFQRKHKIVNSEQSLGAGSYGPKTRKQLREVYSEHLEEIEKKEAFLSNVKDIQDASQEKAQQYIESLGRVSYGETSYEVREVQKTLAKLGYFNHNDTAIFADITRGALVDYQIEKGIINSSNDLGAGTFGPNTRKSIIQDLYELYLMEYLNDKDLTEAYNEYLITINA